MLTTQMPDPKTSIEVLTQTGTETREVVDAAGLPVLDVNTGLPTTVEVPTFATKTYPALLHADGDRWSTVERKCRVDGCNNDSHRSIFCRTHRGLRRSMKKAVYKNLKTSKGLQVVV